MLAEPMTRADIDFLKTEAMARFDSKYIYNNGDIVYIVRRGHLPASKTYIPRSSGNNALSTMN